MRRPTHSPEEIANATPPALRTKFNADRDAVKTLKANFSPDGLMSLELASAVKQALTALPENRDVRNIAVSKMFTNEYVTK